MESAAADGGVAGGARGGQVRRVVHAGAVSIELGDAVQIKNHLLKAQLDFLEGFQQRRQTSQ